MIVGEEKREMMEGQISESEDWLKTRKSGRMQYCGSFDHEVTGIVR